MDTTKTINKNFVKACREGDLELVQTILKQTNIPDSIIQNGFGLACIYDTIGVPDYLLENYPKIDISYDNEYIFRATCVY